LDQFWQIGIDGPLGEIDELIEIGLAKFDLSGEDCRWDASGGLEGLGAVFGVFQNPYFT
jgi:hypothetical protein